MKPRDQQHFDVFTGEGILRLMAKDAQFVKNKVTMRTDILM